MKRWIALSLIFISGGAALVFCERHKVEAPVGPQAFLYFVADTEHELTRLPVSFTRLSDEREIEIGNSLAKSYAVYFAIHEPGEETRILAAYVQKVGEGVAARAHRKLPYKFHYIPRPDFINAFALPGGHVFIGEGLIALMDSEDELAAVLGHEVEHIDQYHCAERVQTEAALRRIPLGGLVGIPVEVFEAGYRKDQELEADREGTRLAVNAGYSPLGAIRMFEAFDRLHREHVIHAQSPQEEISRVAEQTLEDYFRSHPLASERIAQINLLIADERWGNLTAEKPLEVEYIFWRENAAKAMARHQYDKAAKLASRSLQLQPDQPGALKILGRAEYLLGDFPAAVGTFRKLLDGYPMDLATVRSYAEALAAARPPQAGLKEFGDWLGHQTAAGSSNQMEVELAGLSLISGDATRAAALIHKAENANGEDWAPVALGRLGWWSYRAGDFARAAELLNRAIEQLPGRAEYQTELGWALIEQRNFESAIARFNASQERDSENTMGLAVAHWQAREPDKALDFLASVAADDPAWLNPRWVTAVYTPRVAASVTEMRAERQKRLSARR